MARLTLNKQAIIQSTGWTEQELLRKRKNLYQQIRNYEDITGQKLKVSATELLNQYAQDLTMRKKSRKSPADRRERIAVAESILSVKTPKKITETERKRVISVEVERVIKAYKNLLEHRGRNGARARKALKEWEEKDGENIQALKDKLKEIAREIDEKKAGVSAMNKRKKIGNRKVYQSS